VAWQFRLLGWTLFGIVALGALAGLAVIGSQVYYEATRTKTGDVEALIEEYVPRAASTEQVLTFLDSRGIEHGAVEPFYPDDPAFRDRDVPLGTSTISAIVRNDGYSLSLVDIEIDFILDERGLLVHTVVREVGR
jgi:hypothetical protein